MKAPLSTILTTHALRIATFTAMLLGLVVTAPLYGQDSERERMNALHKTISASNPAPLEHSERSILATGTELLVDGGFEGGYYGGTLTSNTSGVTGPWSWSNSPSWLNPIWESDSSALARTGSYMVYFNPIGPSQSQIYQKVTFPANVTATLSFWIKFSDIIEPNSADVLGVNFCNPTTGAPVGTFVENYKGVDGNFSWVNYSYDVSAFAGQTVDLLFWTNIAGTSIFQIDDVSILTNPTTPPPSATCTEDALTMCLGGGRYRVTSHWKNQYVGDTVTTPMQKTDLTDIVGAFWKDAGAYQFFVSVNPATAALNGHTWVAINTFSGVEFWVDVTDTVNGQYREYHNPPENKTLVEDRTFFVYP